MSSIVRDRHEFSEVEMIEAGYGLVLTEYGKMPVAKSGYTVTFSVPREDKDKCFITALVELLGDDVPADQRFGFMHSMGEDGKLDTDKLWEMFNTLKAARDKREAKEAGKA